MTLAEALRFRHSTAFVARVLRDHCRVSLMRAIELTWEAEIPVDAKVRDLTTNQRVRLLAVATRVA